MKPNPPTAWNPARLDARRFAEAGGELRGEVQVADLSRLSEDLHAGGEGAAPDSVTWQARAELRPAAQGGAPAAWMHLEASAEVPLTCQRCLGPVQVTLQLDRWFRFVATEAVAEAEDDDCEEDLLALEPRPNLIELLEDELLMALPLVPMHETCPVAVPMGSTDLPEEDEAAPTRQNPFQALAQLKRPRG
ncbi:YceD family protein [Hydrogenophaga sp.]|uniref:YceD family protein n=1 Tax=Hydrogenophaga sp. TaxID=1904254 RepID=UPI0025BE093D|nr:YceD family protein [Hydrogenophaga sp.]